MVIVERNSKVLRIERTISILPRVISRRESTLRQHICVDFDGSIKAYGFGDYSWEYALFSFPRSIGIEKNTIKGEQK